MRPTLLTTATLACLTTISAALSPEADAAAILLRRAEEHSSLEKRSNHRQSASGSSWMLLSRQWLTTTPLTQTARTSGTLNLTAGVTTVARSATPSLEGKTGEGEVGTAVAEEEEATTAAGTTRMQQPPVSRDSMPFSRCSDVLIGPGLAAATTASASDSASASAAAATASSSATTGKARRSELTGSRRLTLACCLAGDNGNNATTNNNNANADANNTGNNNSGNNNNGGGGGGGDLQSSFTLDPAQVQKGFALDGNQVPAAGQAASVTSTNNCLSCPVSRLPSPR